MSRDPAFLERTLDRIGPAIERLYAPRITGTEHLERAGASLVVGNHSGGVLAMLEPLVLAHALRGELREASRLPHLLLHEIMWHTPLAPRLAKLGAMRASRESAEALLAAERPVLVYPGGDREAFRGFRERDVISFGPRRGYVQLAIERGVPVVPVVTAGMHSGFACLGDGHALAARFPLARALRVGVLPITVSFPFGLTIGVPPPCVPITGGVRIRVLPPMRFARSGPEAARDAEYVEACHRAVVETMQRALDELAAQRRDARRASLHAHLDRAVDAIEHITGARRPEAPRRAPIPLRAAAAPRRAA